MSRAGDLPSPVAGMAQGALPLPGVAGGSGLLRRRWVLARFQARGLWRPVPWLAAVLLAGTCLLTLCARWNTDVLVFLGVSLDQFGRGEARESVLLRFLGEFGSWAWIFVLGGAYMLPVVLLPLAMSYSVSSVLWLRLSPCSSRDLALARVARLLLGLVVVVGLSIPPAWICAWYHGVPALPLMRQVGGMASHLVWSGGLVLALSGWIRGEVARLLTAFFAFLVPMLSYGLYLALHVNLSDDNATWWPYTFPFLHDAGNQGKHYLASLAVGGGLVILSILTDSGRLLERTPGRENA